MHLYLASAYFITKDEALKESLINQSFWLALFIQIIPLEDYMALEIQDLLSGGIVALAFLSDKFLLLKKELEKGIKKRHLSPIL